ncbi:MAG: DNA-directed RNA polymerase subunit K [Candidatus Woesearchaeota archaeon]
MVEKKEENSEIKYTKYEIARMLGSRALQLSLGAPFLVKISDKELEEMRYNPLRIAELEFKQGVLPITVKRPLPGQKK